MKGIARWSRGVVPFAHNWERVPDSVATDGAYHYTKEHVKTTD